MPAATAEGQETKQGQQQTQGQGSGQQQQGQAQGQGQQAAGAAGSGQQAQGKGAEGQAAAGGQQQTQQGQEGKAGGDKTFLGGAKGKEQAGGAAQKTQEGKTGAPESYDFKLPEGVTPNKTMLDEFSGMAKELDLSQEQAQKLVDFQTKHALAEVDAHLANYKKITEGWKGETAKLFKSEAEREEASVNAARALDRFGGEKLRKTLDELGVGDHPELVQAWIAIGKAMGEDKHLEGGRVATQMNPEESRKRRMFPTMYPADK